MSVATRFRSTLRRVPCGSRFSATLETVGGVSTTATVVEGVFRSTLTTPPANRTEQLSTRQVGILAEGLDFPPAVAMRLTIAGAIWTVDRVEIIEPTDAGVPILYGVTVVR